MSAPPATVDEYLAALPAATKSTLAKVRQAIKTIAPDAIESISYGLPTYKHRGRPLIYFGAAKKHWSLYATPKGTLRYGLDEVPDDDVLRGFIAERRAAIDGS